MALCQIWKFVVLSALLFGSSHAAPPNHAAPPTRTRGPSSFSRPETTFPNIPPSRATSAEETPSGTTPSEATLSEANPSEGTPSGATPSKATSSKTTRSEATPSEATSTEATSAKTTSSKTTSSKTATSKTTSSKTTSSSIESESDTPAEDDSTIEVPKGDWISPKYEYFFQFPLPIGPKKEPKYAYHPENTDHACIDFYEVEVKTIHQQIYPNLPATEMTAYDGESPGPMFVMEQGREAVVRFTNNGPYNMSVHVHGQYNRAPFDGWASDYAKPGQYKDYYYPNAQNARTAWFHDHTEFTTAEHAYRGQEGSYIITDPHERSLNFPKGDYDIPLVIGAKFYNSDASLRFNTNNSKGIWGDVIQVNGQPWPYVKVEPRKYRFRLLNGSLSRTFKLFFALDSKVGGKYKVGTKKSLKFDVIGADAGLLAYPVQVDEIELTMGERYEIIIDFADYAGQNFTLKNQGGMGEGIDYAATDMVMRIAVGDEVTDDTNNGDIPSVLRDIPPPPDTDSVGKNFTFERINETWLINGVGFADVEHRILAKPDRGGDEIWELSNGDGKGSHPIHIHLVDFQILSRTGGRDKVLPYEAAGLKDVVWLAGGERIRVLARYAPWNGVYMFHCHNLIHEDHDMMVVFNVTNLEKWGYDNSTYFIDPMQPEFRPKDIEDSHYTEDFIMDKMSWFYGTSAYNHGDVAGVYSALDALQTST